MTTSAHFHTETTDHIPQCKTQKMQQTNQQLAKNAVIVILKHNVVVQGVQKNSQFLETKL